MTGNPAFSQAEYESARRDRIRHRGRKWEDFRDAWLRRFCRESPWEEKIGTACTNLRARSHAVEAIWMVFLRD